MVSVCYILVVELPRRLSKLVDILAALLWENMMFFGKMGIDFLEKLSME